MSKQQKRRASDVSERLIRRIIAAKPKSKLFKSQNQVNAFLRIYFGDVPVEDLQDKSVGILGQAAISHLEFAAVKKPGEAKLRIFNPDEKQHGYDSRFTIVEMVNDNMPFLVDSVSAAIIRQNLNVHMTIHPVLRITRDGKGKITAIGEQGKGEAQDESYVRFTIDREHNVQHLNLLEHEIHKVLADVRVAVRDWREMRGKMLETSAALKYGPAGADADLRDESEALLRWLADDHFTFLGYREYRLNRRGERLFLRPVKGSGLGVLTLDERGGRAIELSKEMRRHTRSKDWLIITKANSRSTIHRHSFLDYIGVKIYDSNGEPIGEKRFIGLYTSVAYSENPRNIPLLRLKVDRVLESSRVDQSGHRGKALLHILDSFPRDELFQSSVRDLVRTTNGILNLQDRQRVKLFLRRDTFRRFFSCIVYVPREKYTTATRRRIEDILQRAFLGISVDSSVQISDSPLARVHTIVRTGPTDKPKVSILDIEQRIADAVVSWQDKLRAQLTEKFGPEEGILLFRKYGASFRPAYESDTPPAIACLDIKRVDGLQNEEHNEFLLLHKERGTPADQLNFRTFRKNKPLELSRVLPTLEDMGTYVYSERPYKMQITGGDLYWIQDFVLHYPNASDLDIDSAAVRFQDSFKRALAGTAENDGLDRLVLAAGLDWRETALIRCYTKFLLQIGVPFSQNYMEDVFLTHASLVKDIIEQFRLQFEPGIAKKKRAEQLENHMPRIARGVIRAANLDEDRILTAFSGAVSATVRTNYYQRDEDSNPKPCISIKLNSRELPEVPLPRPKHEIFVYSSRVEGVHLRGGDVARGGLRWSDRREDFRTEILGLMKAQVVKNTVIVPTGAKGGFVPKKLPIGDRETVMNEAIECYKMFIRSLLDITDNVVDGKIIAPPNVVRRDSDDPYLVVAADKGTATFSDIANGISAEYGFWLDDAFASGGSAGYDHKKMGITAKGAWEAVKRHFRASSINIQKQNFTVAGIGDMSGDVFGNGMLLSRKINLVAAFNHEFIFLDPDPDTAASYRERKRLFTMKGSRWSDYKEDLISKGGGVFSRQAKQVKLSSEVRAMLNTSETSMQPLELIRAILRMPVDLLWNGGIGTYVKASSESHTDVGDRSNDNVRVNANEMQCRVVGEGGNLGLTQLARIEYSQNGGSINTDFIDNSAGVDCSDREVNIKILLGAVEQEKGLTRKQRNKMLVEMTDDVADFVLRNNYLQTQAISMMAAQASDRLDETARLVVTLEKNGLLDRALEFLPDEAEIDERRQRKQGFTRPEIAVILSYAKIDLYDGLASSPYALDDFLTTDPQRYFPPLLRKRYQDFIPGHRLSRQILATLIANDIVNRMGPTFVQRVQQDTGADVVTIARAYVVAREVCRARNLWSTIESLDNKLPATAQQKMMFNVSRILRHACYWLIDRYGDELDIVQAVDHLRDGMSSIYSRVFSFVSPVAKERLKRITDDQIRLGAPEKLARKMSELLLTRGGLDITDLAQIHRKDTIETARMYSDISDRLGFIWLNRCVEDLAVDGRWQAIARSNLREEFYQLRRELAGSLLKRRSKKVPAELFESWLVANANAVRQFDSILAEMRLRPETDFAVLSVAAQEIRKLINQ